MERRDIVIGVIILVILAIAILLLRRNPTVPEVNTPVSTPSVESRLEDSFKVDIPDDAEKATFKDVANVNGTAIATRSFASNKFNATVLADLPDPTTGFYQVWVAKGGVNDAAVTFVSLGRMSIAKGGWMVDFQSNTNYSDYDTILISQESVADSKPEKHILEGSF